MNATFYAMNLRDFAMTIGLVLCASSAVSESKMHKWVDEKGKIHYGDRVPEQYRDSAEAMGAVDNISIVGPEAEVRRQNKQHVSQLRRETAQQKETKARAGKNDDNTTKPQKRSRSWCRDRFPNNVKLRTECLRSSSSNED